MTEYMNIRDTARALGVHENTIRNWCREGVIKYIELPSVSRFKRIPVSEVHRLQEMMEKNGEET